MGFDAVQVAKDFPILQRKVHGKRLAFLDSGASAQKPAVVIEAMEKFLRTNYSNVHRGLYTLSQESSELYENTREKVAQFLKTDPRQVIFVRGVTEGINLVAQTWGRANLKAGDEILLSVMEHHANIVPWQLLAEQLGVHIKVVNLTPEGALDLADFQAKLTDKTKLVAITHMSNVLGTQVPIAQLVQWVRARPALSETKILVDGAQAIVHQAVCPDELDIDFYTFSAHKLYGPSGIGILWGRYAVLEAMPPFHGGGDMIETVSFAGSTFQKPPFKFEAGTPSITATVGFGVALDYLQPLDWAAIRAHEQTVAEYAMDKLQANPQIKILPRPPKAGPVICIEHKTVHSHDLATILDMHGVCVRAGHHCAMPLLEYLGHGAVTRISLGLYNTQQDIDQLLEGITQAEALFK